MKLKILYLILFILIFIPIGLCEIIKDDININNIKIYDKNNEIISIYDKNNEKSMNIKLISTLSDIDKLIKIVEITNYIEYIPNKENDFITKTKKIYGKNDVYKIEYFIEKYNYTFDYIIINKTIFNNKTGKNETKLINKTIVKDIKPFWIKFDSYNKTIFKNEIFKLKIIHYKKPELGFFKIQTSPIFKNIECKEFTWWLGNWNLKRPILINNTYGDNVTNYQLKSVNLSEYQINASSTRIINETSGLIQNHWNESIDENGNLEYVWCNFSKINNGSWINNTYYIYYQSNPIVNNISNGENTFLFFDSFNNDFSKWNLQGNPIISQGKIILNNSDNIISKDTFNFETIVTSKLKADEQDSSFIGYYTNGNNRMQLQNSDFGSNDDFDNIMGVFFKSGNWDGFQFNDGWNDFRNTYYEYTIKRINISYIEYNQENNSNIYTNPTYIPIGNMSIEINVWDSSQESTVICDWIFVREYTNNEPELWTVGNIEYPEDLDMNCSLKIITHLTEKQIQIVNMTGNIVNENTTNKCINLTYDSYIVYMSNPIKISSFTGLLNILDNILVQFLLFIFLIIIATLFYVFIQIVKKKGFKL